MLDPNEPKKETVRIDLPPQVVAKSPGPDAKSRPDPVPLTPAPSPPSSGPKKETARIAPMPDQPSKPLSTVPMKTTQPVIAMPHTLPQNASIAVAPPEERAMPLCWVLLGVSTIILIIQIWTYFS